MRVLLLLSLLFLNACEVDNSKRYKGITRVVKKIKGEEEKKPHPQAPQSQPSHRQNHEDPPSS